MSTRFVARCPRLQYYKELHESALSGGGTARVGPGLWSVGSVWRRPRRREFGRSGSVSGRRRGPGSASLSAAKPAAPSPAGGDEWAPRRHRRRGERPGRGRRAGARARVLPA